MPHKIVYFLDFPYGTGGSSKVLLTQACIMHRRGYDTVVVIPNDENGGHLSVYDEICAANHLHTVMSEYPVSTAIEQIDIMETMDCYDRIVRLLAEEKPDLVHSVQMNAAVEMAARELGIPHLMNIYQTDTEMFAIKWMAILPEYHSADSELFSKRWGEGLGIPSRCIRVAYQCGRGQEKKMDQMSMPLRILAIAVLAEYKNQMELLRFLLMCKENGIQVFLTILGEYNTEYGKKCLGYVKQNNLQTEVDFRGYVHNVEDYFAEADLMVLSSKVESFPGVVVESMANRVPVLATPVAGIPELLRDGYDCFLTKGYLAEDLYEAFGHYLACRENGGLQDIIDHAYETYSQNHSHEAVGTGLERYYKWILDDYKAKTSFMGMDEVKARFKSFLEGKDINTMSRETRQSLWYLYHIHEIDKTRKFQRIVIWGAGKFGRVAKEWLELLGCMDRLVGYIDTYKRGKYLGYPILEDRELVIKNCDMVLLAVGETGNCLKIMEWLERLGKRRNRDYFLIHNEPIRI